MTDQQTEQVTQDTLTDAEKEDWRELKEKPVENLTDAEKTSKVKLSLKRRFDAPEWSLAFELASPSGRRADAIAVNTFPSRNFKVVGFEIKASRSDWLSEKDDGEKADYFVQACDEWYVVAWSGIVKESELPEGWGLFELKPNSEQLWKQQDSELTDYQQGEPDKAFWGRFIQKTIGDDANYTKEDLREARKRGYEEAEEELSGRRLDREAEKMKDKAETVDKLREAGLFGFVHPVDDERIERLEKARKFLKSVESDRHRTLEGKLQFFEKRIQDDMEEMAELAEGMRDRLDEIREAKQAAVSQDGGGKDE